MKIETRTFGIIEIGKDSPYIKQVIQVNGRPENCSLYTADEFSDDVVSCRRLGELIDDINALDNRARRFLSRELQVQNEVVVDFLDFHLEELNEEIKTKLQVAIIDQALLLKSLDLRGIGFHLSEGRIEFAFDYCPGEDFSDQLLVVRFSASGDIVEVAHEC